ncbi:MAG: TPR domain protein [Candidatus Peregrinibacteria bacterium GW2011_GWA2_33_10]|nr:MAG: TPR domain protein [Candidatus Peregrinibacteria bacterium GW2011_GWA2_33_10]KKP39626.1 MAG: ATPase AAA [Candidatus Peregrinibacteria bacterium GW2011_GWC2_33_13]
MFVFYFLIIINSELFIFMNKLLGATRFNIELNDDFVRAFEFLTNTNKSVFITGKAGTGKSTLLQYFRDNTAKNVAVLAPTGVAALNVKGQTIHSFFGFPPTITPHSLFKKKFSKKVLEVLRKLDAIIIDEVSMVRADLMDCVDEALRFCLNDNSPFGGLQMIFIGDLYQLPPVVADVSEKELFRSYYKSPYFFDAKVFENFEMEFIELEKIYRQRDDDFIELLNKIRNNSVEDADIERLNSRRIFDFNDDSGEFYITLTTTNSAADEINIKKLAQLESKTRVFYGHVNGNFDKKYYPASLDLELKEGAQIMLLNNDSAGRWVNGSVGVINNIISDNEGNDDILEIELSNGEIVEVSSYTWEVSQYFYNKDLRRLDAEVVGTFTQYPVRLAWAVTIHKSQGKTFDRVIVDIGRGSFTHGQIYVAISRCTSFEGLILKKPILKKHIWMDQRIVNFVTHYQYTKSEENMSLEEKLELITQAINSGSILKIIYLKPDDTKSKREIKPQVVGKMGYLGKSFIGVEAYCLKRKAKRVFRVDRILELR